MFGRAALLERDLLTTLLDECNQSISLMGRLILAYHLLEDGLFELILTYEHVDVVSVTVY